MAIELRRLDIGRWRDRARRPKTGLPRIDLGAVEVPRPDLSGANEVLADAGRAMGGASRAVGGALSEGIDAAARRLDTVGRDVRSIRLVRGNERPKGTNGTMVGVALLGGLGMGMALMYFLDPDDGQARRDRLRQQILALIDVTRAEGPTGRRPEDAAPPVAEGRERASIAVEAAGTEDREWFEGPTSGAASARHAASEEQPAAPYAETRP